MFVDSVRRTCIPHCERTRSCFADVEDRRWWPPPPPPPPTPPESRSHQFPSYATCSSQSIGLCVCARDASPSETFSSKHPPERQADGYTWLLPPPMIDREQRLQVGLVDSELTAPRVRWCDRLDRPKCVVISTDPTAVRRGSSSYLSASVRGGRAAAAAAATSVDINQRTASSRRRQPYVTYCLPLQTAANFRRVLPTNRKKIRREMTQADIIRVQFVLSVIARMRSALTG